MDKRKQFGVSINVWRLAGGTLNITCNFLYCNHQVHRDFLITLGVSEQNSSKLQHTLRPLHGSFSKFKGLIARPIYGLRAVVQ